LAEKIFGKRKKWGKKLIDSNNTKLYFGGEIYGGEIYGGEIVRGEMVCGENDGGEIVGGEIYGGVNDGGEIYGGVNDGGEIYGGELTYNRFNVRCLYVFIGTLLEHCGANGKTVGL